MKFSILQHRKVNSETTLNGRNKVNNSFLIDSKNILTRHSQQIKRTPRRQRRQRETMQKAVLTGRFCDQLCRFYVSLILYISINPTNILPNFAQCELDESKTAAHKC